MDEEISGLIAFEGVWYYASNFRKRKEEKNIPDLPNNLIYLYLAFDKGVNEASKERKINPRVKKALEGLQDLENFWSYYTIFKFNPASIGEGGQPDLFSSYFKKDEKIYNTICFTKKADESTKKFLDAFLSEEELKDMKFIGEKIRKHSDEYFEKYYDPRNDYEIEGDLRDESLGRIGKMIYGNEIKI